MESVKTKKKPPKWWLISSYKNVLQVWSGGLFADAELPEYFLERFFCCYPLFAGDVGEVVDDHAEVFCKEVAAETDVHGVDDTLQTFVGTEKGRVVAGRSYHDVAL